MLGVSTNTKKSLKSDLKVKPNDVYQAQIKMAIRSSIEDEERGSASC